MKYSKSCLPERTISVHIGMPDFGDESDLGSLIRVIFREFDDQVESAAFPNCVVGTAGAKNDGSTKKKEL